MVRGASRLVRLAAVHLTATAAAGVMALAPAGAQEPLLMTVTATTQNACNFDASTAELDFETVIPGQSKTATATLTVLCTFEGSPKVYIDEGGSFSGGSRHLKHEEHDDVVVAYRVCTDEPSNEDCQDWPNTGFEVDVSGGGGAVNVYGLITEAASNDFTREGNYNDTLVVEVSLE